MARYKTLAEAIDKEIGGISYLSPTTETPAQNAARKLAAIEHAPGVAVRMNQRTYKIEYYEIATGRVVSSHI